MEQRRGTQVESHPNGFAQAVRQALDQIFGQNARERFARSEVGVTNLLNQHHQAYITAMSRQLQPFKPKLSYETADAYFGELLHQASRQRTRLVPILINIAAQADDMAGDFRAYIGLGVDRRRIDAAAAACRRTFHTPDNESAVLSSTLNLAVATSAQELNYVERALLCRMLAPDIILSAQATVETADYCSLSNASSSITSLVTSCLSEINPSSSEAGPLGQAIADCTHFSLILRSKTGLVESVT